MPSLDEHAPIHALGPAPVGSRRHDLLRVTIEKLAAGFARDVIGLVVAAPVGELAELEGLPFPEADRAPLALRPRGLVEAGASPRLTRILPRRAPKLDASEPAPPEAARRRRPPTGETTAESQAPVSSTAAPEVIGGAAGTVRPASGHAPRDVPPKAVTSTAATVPAEEINRAKTTEGRGDSTRTHEQRAADDAALLACGEPLTLLSEIAGQLGVSAKTLRWVVHREGGPLIRYASAPRPVRYCVADVRAAVEAARPDIQARRRCAEEIEAANRARGEAARAAKAVPSRKPTHVRAPAKPRPVVPAPVSATRMKPAEPEVLVVRRPGSRSPSP